MEEVIAVHRMVAENGTIYEVDEIQEYEDASNYKGKARVPGLKRLELQNGDLVNYIDDDTFKIVFSGEIIRRVKGN